MNIPPKLLASRARTQPLIESLLQHMKAQGSVLDLGSGDGRLCSKYMQYLSPKKIICLDSEPALAEHFSSSDKLIKFILADSLNLPFGANEFDTVIAVNSLHEVCYHSLEEKRKSYLQILLKSLRKIMRNQGELLIFDGVMPPNQDKLVTLHSLTQNAKSLFEHFRDTYTGLDLLIEDMNPHTFKLPLGNLIAFFTKYSYINTVYWGSEKNQLYPFLTLEDFQSCLQNESFEIAQTLHPTERLGLDLFLQDFKVEGLTSSNFPYAQVAILAKLNK